LTCVYYFVCVFSLPYMLIVRLFYYCLLKFTTYTGMGLTNEDSRAVFLFSLVFLFNIGSILNYMGYPVENISWLLATVVLMLFFFGSYHYFTQTSVKIKMKKSYDSLNPTIRMMLNLFVTFYFFLSAIVFAKSFD